MPPAAPSHAPRDPRARAFAIIRERSFRFGDFTLASGKKSTFYLDLKPTMFDPEGSRLLAELVLARLEAVKADYVGGLEVGAIPLVATAVMLSGDRPRPIGGFFVRKEAKDHGTKKVVEAPPGALRGKRVAILEDVTTRGESPMRAVKAAQDEGATVALVLSIVDREDGAAQMFKAAGIPFDTLFKASEFLAR
jgi:orotate phosphoribosyltransferase